MRCRLLSLVIASTPIIFRPSLPPQLPPPHHHPPALGRFIVLTAAPDLTCRLTLLHSQTPSRSPHSTGLCLLHLFMLRLSPGYSWSSGILSVGGCNSVFPSPTHCVVVRLCLDLTCKDMLASRHATSRKSSMECGGQFPNRLVPAMQG